MALREIIMLFKKKWRCLVTVCVSMIIIISMVTRKTPFFEDITEKGALEIAKTFTHEDVEDNQTLNYSHFRKDGQTLSFIVIGDWGLATNMQTEVAQAMQQVATSRGCDFIISTGDNFYPAGIPVPKAIKSQLDKRKYVIQFLQKNWMSIYNLTGIKNLTWYISSGNHDHGFTVRDGRQWNQIGIYHGMPTWFYPKFSYNFTASAGSLKATFSTLDTHVMLTDGKAYKQQKDAFIRSLSEHDKSIWKIAWTHIPPYSSSHMYNVNYKFHRDLVGHFDRSGLDIHFAGHDHTLQHLKRGNVNYFISGTGSKKPYRYSKVAATKLRYFRAQSVAFFNRTGFIHVELSETVANISFIGKLGKVLYNTVVPKRNKAV